MRDRILVLHFLCSQIWLNLVVNDHQFGKNLKLKKEHWKRVMKRIQCNLKVLGCKARLNVIPFHKKNNDVSKLESFSTSKIIVTLIYGEFYCGVVL